MRSLLTPAQRDHIAELAAAGVGPTAIAHALGVRPSAIASAYRALRRAGVTPHRPSTRGPDWTRADETKLIDLVEAGHSYDAIARKLKRSRVAVQIKAKRLGTRITTTRASLSALAAARALGLSCAKIISSWIRRGWLKARNAGTADRPLWRITWDDLTAFMEQPDHWIAWSVERIPDPALREWAAELRAGAERYVSQAEVARRYHVKRPGRARVD